MSERSILFISADVSAAGRVEEILRRHPADQLAVKRVDALFDGLRSLQDGHFDLILSDLILPDGQDLGAVVQLRQHAPLTPVIAFCPLKDRDAAVEAVRKGAYDFFCYDDLDPGKLLKSIHGAIQHAESAESEKRAAERRTNARFPCRLAVSYQTLERPILSGQGISETLNMSSKGLLFTSNEQFHAGQLVQVSVDWPARLENQIPLKLVAEGRVVRNANGQTAMTIDKYEFRTRRTVKPVPGEKPVQPGTVPANKPQGAHERRSA